MDAEEYLSRAFVFNRKIRFKEKQLREMKDSVPYSGIKYGDVKIDTNMRSSAVEYSAIRVVSLSDEIDEDKKELERIMESISRTIKRLGDTNTEIILEMRYLSFMDWDEIISRMGFSERYIFLLHIRALKRIKTFI